MPSTPDFPKPKFITGGCLCGAVRYKIEFPEDFDFTKTTGTCQCTQCRRNTGALFYPHLRVDSPATFSWMKPDPAPFPEPPSQYKTYSATPSAKRGFCATCGGFLTWATENRDVCSIAIGTVDPLYLWGDGADGVTERDGQVVPKEGFGVALAGGYGTHEWCGNQIKGVTDNLATLGVGRGKRWMGESGDESAGVEG